MREDAAQEERYSRADSKRPAPRSELLPACARAAGPPGRRQPFPRRCGPSRRGAGPRAPPPAAPQCQSPRRPHTAGPWREGRLTSRHETERAQPQQWGSGRRDQWAPPPQQLPHGGLPVRLSGTEAGGHPPIFPEDTISSAVSQVPRDAHALSRDVSTYHT